MNVLPPAPFPIRVQQRIVFLVQLCCITGFFIGSIIPLSLPESAASLDAVEYLESEQFLLVEEGFVMKTASISEQGHRLAYSKGILHTVRASESVNSLADLYGISPETITWANTLGEGQVIHPGDTLLILPVDGVLHTVRRGQNLVKIAELYDIPVEKIVAQNQLDGGTIFADQQIIIPGGKPIVEGKIGKTVVVKEDAGNNAVARPGIQPAPPRPTPPPEAEPPTSFGIFQKPCDCTYTQQYRAGHYAVDMSHNGGGPIFAAEDGVILRAEYGWNGGYGNVVEVDHGNGLVTLYAHNSELHVREGQAVRRGDVIAEMGNTGRVYGKTGVHLHFETIQNGVKKNPLLYLQ